MEISSGIFINVLTKPGAVAKNATIGPLASTNSFNN
jgi:hypothetical protein